jgi:very-short-patch-repair endonuclease
MKSILPLLIVLMAIMFFLKIKVKNEIDNRTWPFYAKKILTQPEQVLYFRLIEALPEHVILAQVQLSQILGVKRGNNYQSWLNRINRMSADFVVCNKDSSIVAIIELDDSTHLRRNRQIADAKKDKALESADVRIIRWNVKSIPDISTIQNHLETKTIQPENIN